MKQAEKPISEITKEQMADWFFSNYADPAHFLPYETKEGGYQYIWGEPKNAEEALYDQFIGQADDELIQDALQLISTMCDEYEIGLDPYTDPWSPRPPDEEFDYEPFGQDLILKTYEETMDRCHSMVVLSQQKILGQEDGPYLRKMVYSYIITAIETYLDEVVHHYLLTKHDCRMKFLSESNEKIEVKDTVLKEDELVKKVLSRQVWHQIKKGDSIDRIFYRTFGTKIEAPELILNAIKTRHILVHRNGKTREGEEVKISVEMLFNLMNEANKFITNLGTRIFEATAPDTSSVQFGEKQISLEL